jgi:hypothetical protein
MKRGCLSCAGHPKPREKRTRPRPFSRSSAWRSIGDDEPRSRGVVGVGAVSLWMRAGKLDHAEELVRLYLSRPINPGFERELLELLNEARRSRDETSAVPVEPDERATVVVDALRKVEEDLGAGRVRFWSIKGVRRTA